MIKIKRISNARIIPMEIWDCVTPKGILWRHMYKPYFPRLLAGVAREIHAGIARSISDGVTGWAGRSFDSIYIGGGGALNKNVIDTLHELPWPLVIARTPEYAGELGGKDLLEKHDLKGFTIDVGQTRVKVSTHDRGLKRFMFERDFDLMPIASEVPVSGYPMQREIFCRFIGDILSRMFEPGNEPEGVVLGLPCSIDREGIPGSSSYAGMDGHTDMVETIFKLAGLERTTVLLLNDAELVARSARQDPWTQGFSRTLVLTLGFGAGAAVLTRE